MRKKPAKPAPVVITGKTGTYLGFRSVGILLDTLPMSELKEHLRARGIPIPKDKGEMVSRLADWATRNGGTYTLTLQ